MDKQQLERRIWEVTGRDLTGAQIDAILDATQQYAAELPPRDKRGRLTAAQARPAVLHHTGGTDLHPVISVLAQALLTETETAAGGRP